MRVISALSGRAVPNPGTAGRVVHSHYGAVSLERADGTVLYRMLVTQNGETETFSPPILVADDTYVLRCTNADGGVVWADYEPLGLEMAGPDVPATPPQEQPK